MKKWGLWCGPKDGSQNGMWHSFNGKDWVFYEEAYIEKNCRTLSKQWITWYYEVREYHDE